MHSRPTTVNVHSDSHYTNASGRILATSGSGDVKRGCGYTYPTSRVPAVYATRHYFLQSPEGTQESVRDTHTYEFAKTTRVVTASREGDGITRVSSIVAQAADNHGLYLCFGCAVRSLPDVCPPTVPLPATTPPRMTPTGSKDHHTGLLDHVVGGSEESSDQAVSVRHAFSPPLKRQRHAPKELYTAPDWNSLPKQITSLSGTPRHAGMGTSAPDHGPVPTSPHIQQLVLEELRIIAGTIPLQTAT